MGRYINIDDISLRKTISVGGLSAKALWRRIQQEPTIDIVRCKECKYCVCGQCWKADGLDKLDGNVAEDDFCSRGERGGE